MGSPISLGVRGHSLAWNGLGYVQYANICDALTLVSHGLYFGELFPCEDGTHASALPYTKHVGTCVKFSTKHHINLHKNMT